MRLTWCWYKRLYTTFFLIIVLVNVQLFFTLFTCNQINNVWNTASSLFNTLFYRFAYFIMVDIIKFERFNWFNINNVVPGWEISVQVLTKFCSDVWLFSFIHRARVTHVCVSKISHIFPITAPSYYLNQCYLIVSWVCISNISCNLAYNMINIIPENNLKILSAKWWTHFL